MLGTLVGALPGAGGPVAAFLSYNEAKRLVKHPETPFGEGAVEGIVASESSNNACIGGALIPMLTLAVPGDAVTAIILFGYPITAFLLVCTVLVVLGNIPAVKRIALCRRRI